VVLVSKTPRRRKLVSSAIHHSRQDRGTAISTAPHTIAMIIVL